MILRNYRPENMIMVKKMIDGTMNTEFIDIRWQYHELTRGSIKDFINVFPLMIFVVAMTNSAFAATRK